MSAGHTRILFRLVLVTLFLTLIAGWIYAGYLFYLTVRNFVAYTELPDLRLPILRLPARVGQSGLSALTGELLTEPVGESGATPVVTTTVIIRQQPPDWSRRERVNFLLLGIDQRAGEQGPWRTDTMIVVSLDPATGGVSMLSIPRDLWVPIPGYGENRINTAHFTGDARNYPGGGPALAKKTVSENLGIPIHYYVRVNFSGFERLIDLIGGIDINVSHEINDPLYPDDNYGYEPLYIPAGFQHMDGETALKYARSRRSSSDFDRMNRQQQVLLAIASRVMSLNLLPTLLRRLPELTSTLQDSVKTDLQFADVLELAKLADELDLNKIQTAVIDESMTIEHITPSGAQVLLPDREKIRPLVDRLFSSPVVAAPMPTPVVEIVQVVKTPVNTPVSPTPLPLSPAEVERRTRLREEKARIVIQNGTPEHNFAARIAAYLSEQGYQVVEYGDADRTDYPHTVIVVYTAGKTYTVEQLAATFQVTQENIRSSPNLKGEVDIRLIVGRDFQLPGL